MTYSLYKEYINLTLKERFITPIISVPQTMDEFVEEIDEAINNRLVSNN